MGADFKDTIEGIQWRLLDMYKSDNNRARYNNLSV